MYEEVHIGRLYEKIVEQIEKRIVDGELNAGDKLPSERELAIQFGVSRTSIREAMKALTLRGLIVVTPGRGTFITDQTSQALRHSMNLMFQVGKMDANRYLLELREILEPEIAAMAASRATQENLEAMREAVEAMDRSMDDVSAYVEADLDFHLSLAESAHNPIILSLLDSLIGELREQRFRSANVEGALHRGQPNHKAVLVAIEQGDVEGARHTMHKHMKQAREDIEEALNLVSK